VGAEIREPRRIDDQRRMAVSWRSQRADDYRSVPAILAECCGFEHVAYRVASAIREQACGSVAYNTIVQLGSACRLVALVIEELVDAI
jgi:hypothetical protein